MKNQTSSLSALPINGVCHGFQLVKKETVASKSAVLYTLKHQKTGAELLYFDRDDENKTFAIAFKTLPENSTGVFHILEHSVLNGSRKYPVKEPFVSMLQSSMQTFLNAFTYSDKTVFPVSSRNEKDFFNLMSVYMDAVFFPMIYQRPEIFMQEGWHYELENETATPTYNGVVFSEMKGVYADVNSVIEEETKRLLFPNTSYGYSSGGHPAHIPELTYQEFIDTHTRFYHPSNSRIFLDGRMDVDAVLQFLDNDYLSQYEYRQPDFDFVLQTPTTAEDTIYYEAAEGEDNQPHMSVAKILCTHHEVETIYAAEILADYLTGSNEAPFKRAVLEAGLAQDVNLEITDGVLQPTMTLVFNNIAPDSAAAIKDFIPTAVNDLLRRGLNRESLTASLERSVFLNKEIREPYGLELGLKALDGWLYGDDPLTHIEIDSIFESLKAKLDTDYFETLLKNMLCDASDKTYLHVFPSLTKGEEDARREAEKLAAVAASWNDAQRKQCFEEFTAMQQWQQSVDSDEILATLPHLALSDVPETVKQPSLQLTKLENTPVLSVDTDTNNLVYLNLFFDISDFSLEELRLANVLSSCFGMLHTKNYTADALQTKTKAILGYLTAGVELTAKVKQVDDCKPYFHIATAMLKEKVPEAVSLLQELLINGLYDETDKIHETTLQNEYLLRQSLLSNGHVFAMTKALSHATQKGAVKELLEGESFLNWFSAFAASFNEQKSHIGEQFAALAAKAFAKNRLFVGYSGPLDNAALHELIVALPETVQEAPTVLPVTTQGNCAIEIPAGIGFSAFGHNLYALGGDFSGTYSVLSSLVSYAYLWNTVRVQGGAYGTGMRVTIGGDVVCYSYRDPHLENSCTAFQSIPDFLKDFLEQQMPLDDIIIGTVNTTEPLLGPAEVCSTECLRYLNGISHEAIATLRKDILGTTPQKLSALIDTLRAYTAHGKFCAVGDKTSVAFVRS